MPKILIDPNQEHYSGFFKEEWGQHLLDTTRGTPLFEPAFALAISWKSQSQAHALPWILVESLGLSWSDPDNNPIGKSRRWLRKLSEELFHKVELTNMKQKQVRKALDEITERFDKVDSPPVDMRPIWESLCDEPNFHTAINGLMRDVFCTLYHDYENYLRRVASAIKEEEVRFTRKDRNIELLTECLGPAITNSCYTDRAIEVPLLVRNAFAHVGGKQTTELKAVTHDFPVDEGHLHVLASHNIELYKVLAVAVDTVTVAALEKLAGGASS